MIRLRPALALFLVLALAIVPGLAFARVGGGSSMGSRGSMTFSAPPATRTAPYAAPIQRSITPQYNPAPGMGAPSYAPGYGGYSRGGAFTSGLLGGLLGAGIGGLLFGHGLFGGMSGGGSVIGLLIQLALLYFIGRWLYRTFFQGQALFAGGGGMGQGGMGGVPPGAPQPGRGNPPPIALSPADYTAFEQLLHTMQAAWSAQDLNTLRSVATPEMVGYFGEQLADLTSRGLRNTVRDVRLEQGDLAQAWAEGPREYATVAMRFSMVDVTVDASGRVVDGSPTERQLVTELWTFVRSRGGRWILSAIQQAR